MSRSVVTGKVIELNIESRTGIILSKSPNVRTYTPFSSPKRFISYILETMLDNEEVTLELHPTNGRLYSILENVEDTWFTR